MDSYTTPIQFMWFTSDLFARIAVQTWLIYFPPQFGTASLFLDM